MTINLECKARKKTRGNKRTKWHKLKIIWRSRYQKTYRFFIHCEQRGKKTFNHRIFCSNELSWSLDLWKYFEGYSWEGLRIVVRNYTVLFQFWSSVLKLLAKYLFMSSYSLLRVHWFLLRIHRGDQNVYPILCLVLRIA